MRTPLLCTLAVLLAAVAACGEDTTDVSATPDTTAEVDAGELCLVVETGGGFVPVEVNLGAFPELVVAGSTAWTPAAQIAIYPPPAVPAVQSASLDPTDLEALAARVEEDAALFQNVDFGQPPVADLPTTSITVDQGDEERRLEVYGLGDPADTTGLSPEQVEAREAVRDLIADLRGLVDSPEREWEVGLPPEIRVSAIPVDATVDRGHDADYETPPDAPADGPGGDETAEEPIPWPAGVEEPSFADSSRFGCVALSGTGRDQVLEAARSASALTVWQLSSGLHHIVVRPLFPGEPACP